jgi:hypothetical protein
MKFDITEIEELSGDKASIYSVVIDGQDETLLEQFFNDNEEYKEELSTILSKIKTMADKTGCRKCFFKEGEGKLADGVVALKGGKLRLYGLYFNNTVVLFGSGGYKDVRAYQDDPSLNYKAEEVKQIANKINKAILDGSIKIENGEINDEDWEDYE